MSIRTNQIFKYNVKNINQRIDI
ncbi:hypothetical protein KL86PLE_130612 [uncultured Pleomorphomonas sp.]|uniref:Uncharacterized protein n=1 Tax=uncultured Pleomorphomonas sp. TaxID=442121 RepID=A0A212LCC8_9HYPH|nr:hypothetical protein KL86PLE_130612 [uncultured Pleomorphomonas sp.]